MTLVDKVWPFLLVRSHSVCAPGLWPWASCPSTQVCQVPAPRPGWSPPPRQSGNGEMRRLRAALKPMRVTPARADIAVLPRHPAGTRSHPGKGRVQDRLPTSWERLSQALSSFPWAVATCALGLLLAHELHPCSSPHLAL